MLPKEEQVACHEAWLPLGCLLTHVLLLCLSSPLKSHSSVTHPFEIPFFQEVPPDLLEAVSELPHLGMGFLGHSSPLSVPPVLTCSEPWPQWKDDKNSAGLGGRSGLWWSSGPGNQKVVSASVGLQSPPSLRVSGGTCPSLGLPEAVPTVSGMKSLSHLVSMVTPNEINKTLDKWRHKHSIKQRTHLFILNIKIRNINNYRVNKNAEEKTLRFEYWIY